MPPPRPVSPLSLEICSPPLSDLDTDGILASDDELNEEERAAQRRRIEKLAESYLQSKPLFILSASLRGPLDGGWVNPWKTDRRRNVPAGRNKTQMSKETEIPASPIIHETNSRKRRTHHEPPEVRSSRPQTVAPESNIHRSGGGSTRLRHFSDRPIRWSVSPSTPRRSIPWAKPIGSNAELRSSSPSKHTNEKWLKKDRKQISFQNVDPPTSPTTTFSSRYSTKSRASKDDPVNSQAASFEHNQTSPSIDEELRASSLPALDPEFSTVHRVSNSITSSPAKDQRLSGISIQKATSGTVVQDPSFYVLAPSSHLPQFEYRRRKSRVNSKTESPKHSVAMGLDVEKDPHSHSIIKENDASMQHVSTPYPMPLDKPTGQEHLEADRKSLGILTSTSTINAIGNPSVSHSAKFRSTSTVHKGNTSDRLPSAQQVRNNPTMTDITSLHSIAVPRSNSEYDGDTIPDPQFSTQAALLLAQRSFQNDLDSPGPDKASPKKQHASDSSNISSPMSNIITPFRRLATPDKVGGVNPVKAPTTVGGQWQSTQCMIDAATPFTFSTEKKAKRRTISPGKHLANKKKAKTASFKLPSSPSLTPGETQRDQVDEDVHSSPVPRHSSGHEIQHSALPMTLTGTTPPTAQEGQQGFPGVDSFNLTQAIADAGSWLQQSFDLNVDIQQYGISRTEPHSSAGTRRSAVAVDSDK
ncbi:uncharacterized protein BDW43DRAFT_152432 [Aspergillus alliaceus]|uniref:uncharacterized protein n=1 Tax=Petromyces alliaceus TaxID=209559 RepID=UPI0012A6EC82|nr:uncharacterized protein BDW43DRAFT_152432 [Aspergillus alliaceus]KAB8238056.1 hypothetical protein BDW43DRAFT_152432 [Aspergillus alliaceus]